MENIMKWLAPDTDSGSVLSSVAAHVLICGAVVVVMGMNTTTRQMLTKDAEIGYEIFDEVPEVMKEVKRAMKMPTPTVPMPTKAETAPVAQELQDAKSDIAGTQAAPKAENSAGADGNANVTATPFYKVKPKYPKAALVSGDEGWVLLTIDVTESGEVENIRVTDGEKRNLFQDEARRAVAKWKYKPFLDSKGNPVRKADHQVRVDFKLSDS